MRGALDADLDDLDDLGELALGLVVGEGGHEFGIAPSEGAASAGIAKLSGDLAVFQVVGEGGKLGADALLEEDSAFLAVGIGGERDGLHGEDGDLVHRVRVDGWDDEEVLWGVASADHHVPDRAHGHGVV